MDYLTRIRARARGEEKGVPGHLHNKSKATEFVNMIGGPTSRVLRRFAKPEDIDLMGLSDDFVLKPVFSSSSFGVMVLEKSAGGGYHDHLRHRDLTVEEIRAEQAELVQRHPKATHEWIVEEKVHDASGATVPDDFKFFTFQGRVGLVHRTIRNQPRNQHAYFDGDFQPLDEQEGQLIWTHPDLVERVQTDPPENYREMLNLVQRISVAVPSPFVRVDMYNTPNGPIFGEFTLVPGTFFYEDREAMGLVLSEQLGHLWTEAESKLCL